MPSPPSSVPPAASTATSPTPICRGQLGRALRERPAVRDQHDPHVGHRPSQDPATSARARKSSDRRGRARVQVADAARAEVAGPALAGLQRDGRLGALLGRVRGRARRRRQALAGRAPRTPRPPGSSASTIVLSPSSALPSSPTPSSAARRAAPSSAALTSDASPRALPGAPQRGAVQRAGRAAGLGDQRPPGRHQHLARRRSASTARPRRPRKPRSRFAPWSPSPIAESSLVSRSASAVTSSDEPRRSRLRGAMSISAPSAGPGSRPARPTVA